jgi:hypothetical protein
MSSKEKVVGCFEVVSFPDLSVVSEMAKIDTGAYSGALHCKDIHVVRRGKDRKRILKFSTSGSSSKPFETDTFEETYVRSSLGHRVKRFIITTRMAISGDEYAVKIGLSDRSDMKREVLVGRRFLREYSILVDVRINSEFDDEGENTR